ncbi:hypothetical protein TRFO_23551 [Tritrichomonas foetus]|uniref:CCZ1/INTU/HSP4 first Longin domain-containing protein n=1 Tax=Tritrichomonas foetus TaxID=1144522 RepID=A0A1J4KET0_9EUKA|nr:hypothetical protein TRFO_23551 [Tritrichomonas foetus]|eukprot:OHT08094.1 hypothetical protein TRFO_23551 [Tritrichomonas foetus]
MSKNSQTLTHKGNHAFWIPTLEHFWSIFDDQTKSIEGFPCFTALLCKHVIKGQKGDEDPSHLIDNIIYMYPSNIPEKVQVSYIGGIISFATFSLVHLNSIPKSFSWSQSEISIHSMRLKNGDYLLFALKLPKFYTDVGASKALERTIRALKYTNPFLCTTIDDQKLNKVGQILKENQKIIISCAFPSIKRLDDPFFFTSGSLDILEPNPSLALATELDHFCLEISPLVLGTATFYQDSIILSSVPHIVSNLFLFYIEYAKSAPNHNDEKFETFTLFIPPNDLNLTNFTPSSNIVSSKSTPNNDTPKDDTSNSSPKNDTPKDDTSRDDISISFNNQLSNDDTLDHKITNNHVSNNDELNKEVANLIQIVLAVITWGDVSFIVLIREKIGKDGKSDKVERILKKIKKILRSGMNDFAAECENLSNKNKKQTKINGVLGFWPYSGIVRKSPGCNSETLARIAFIHKEMVKNEKLLEYISNNGDTQVSGMRLMNIEAFAEVESKGTLKSMVEETYSKIKKFFPNMPNDIQDL